MKKSLLGLAALTGLMFTSCDMPTKDSTSSITVMAYNMVMPLNGGEPVVSTTPCFYTFDSNMSKSTMKVTGNPLTIDNNSYSFVTDTAGYRPYNNYPSSETQTVTRVVSEGVYISGVQGRFTNSHSDVLKNGSFAYNISYITTNLNWIPDHPGVMYKGKSVPVSVIGSYQINDEYLVRTINSDTFYTGITHTSYPGMQGNTVSYEDKSMIYRVLLNLKDKTANLLIYDAKFSDNPNEPKKEAISIPDLKVTFKNGYYTVEGEDITPLVYEAGGLTKNNSFNIKKFVMQTQGALMVDVVMNYEVEHTMVMGEGESAREITVTYTGVFNGASATLPSGMH